MSNPMEIATRRVAMQSSNMGGPLLTQAQIDAGYIVYGDDVYYPDGTIAYGPSVLGLSRPRTGASPNLVFSNAWGSQNPLGGGTPVRLPNGQVVNMNQEQYAAFLAQGGSQISAGIGGAFSGLAASLGISATTLLLLGAGALFLLMREPPKRR